MGTWLSPIAVVTIAAPRPVVTLTEMPPIILQTLMYHNIFFFPYLEHKLVYSWLHQDEKIDDTHLGAKKKTITREAAIRVPANTKKPGAKKSF
jgi:hypothetical protein